MINAVAHILAYAVVLLAALITAAILDVSWLFWVTMAVLVLHAVRSAPGARA